MTRLLASLLLLLMLLPPVLPGLAAVRGTGDDLPACCRRNGAHHCAMKMEQMRSMATALSRQRTVRAPWHPCPFFPHAGLITLHQGWTGGGHSGAAIRLPVQIAPASEADCLARIALARCRDDRGPPQPLA